MEMGQRMCARHAATGKAVPSWLIMDSRQRKFYPWGTAAPGKIPQAWLESGYLKRASNIAQLAEICRIDKDGLEKTVSRFNEFCRARVDPPFSPRGPASNPPPRHPPPQPHPNP